MLTARADGGKDNNYDRYYVVAEINEETLCQAKSIFEDFHSKGVILTENFAQNEWVITNQLRKTTFKFYPNEVKFTKIAKKWLGCNYSCFVDGVKAYTLFLMGSIQLANLREIARKLISLAEKPCEDLPVDTHIIEFLKVLPGGEIKDQVIEDLEERLLFSNQGKIKGRQRVLSDFENYFKFNDALDIYWQKASDNQKLFYFPIYFWWTLTAILPLRPTEFLLTPRQCIEVKKGENILTIRRTNPSTLFSF